MRHHAPHLAVDIAADRDVLALRYLDVHHRLFLLQDFSHLSPPTALSPPPSERQERDLRRSEMDGRGERERDRGGEGEGEEREYGRGVKREARQRGSKREWGVPEKGKEA